MVASLQSELTLIFTQILPNQQDLQKTIQSVLEHPT